MGFILAVFIATISGMAIHLADSTASDGYKNTVKGFAGISLAAALAVLIAAPIITVEDKKILALFLLSILLSVLVATISGMAIHEASASTSDGYKRIVRGFAGFGLAGSLIAIIAIPLIVYKMSQ